MMKLLLCFNANVNQKLAHSRTALHEAARLGLTDFTKLLLKSGADADPRSTYGLTPLALAAQAGHLEIVQELLSRGQEVCVGMQSTGRNYSFSNIALIQFETLEARLLGNIIR